MWKSQKQPCISLSTAEAELVALSEGAKLALYVKNVIDELEMKYYINIFTDNQSAQVIASSCGSVRKVKHMDIKSRFIQEFVQMPFVSLKYMPTEKMIADLLTKPLGKEKFEDFTHKVINCMQAE